MINDFSDLEALYAENDIILSDLIVYEDKYVKPSSTLKPTDQNCVCDNNPAVSWKKSYEIVDFEVRESLYKLFHTKYQRLFWSQKFEIEGWPEGVDRIKPRWNLKEVLRIRQNLRNSQIYPDSQIYYKETVWCWCVWLDFDSWSKLQKKVKFLKNYYRNTGLKVKTLMPFVSIETTDRSPNTPKYDSVPINGRVMTLRNLQMPWNRR